MQKSFEAQRHGVYSSDVSVVQKQTWPSMLWLVRHGESAGNVARQAAEAGGFPVIDILQRDVDVPLSALGERQAAALGTWFKEQTEQPNVILSSPYLRALQTTEGIVQSAGLEASCARHSDERLREKEFGTLDLLTKKGIIAQYPHEAERRAKLGKFYYRPPGGESWCDVILRLRSVLDHIQLQYRGERVLIVAHQVVVLCMRYLLEHMSEAQILGIDQEKDIANCSVTSYQWTRNEQAREAMILQLHNFVTPLTEAGEAVTSEPDKGNLPR